MEPTATKGPSWDRLYEAAAGQAGHFTTRQAAEAGFSSQLLLKHLRAGRLTRVHRGIYRLVHYPASEHEEFVTVWLWSEQVGVFSHETALALHGLSDALPSKIHLTLPVEWQRRRLRIPVDVVLHHADVPAEERSWFGPIPVTNVSRTLNDCAKDGLSPELMRQAAKQALRRGIVTRSKLVEVEIALEAFGGVDP